MSIGTVKVEQHFNPYNYIEKGRLHMKIAVGMSGGIDSSTTALLLKEQNHEVIGVTMYLFEHQLEEIENAKRVCEALGIEHHILDYRKDFEEVIIGNFIETYEKGHTPNPCLHCNRIFKYGRLIEDAINLGAEAFSTGHYVRVHYNDVQHEYELHRAVNARKDQSYNLYHLTQETLSKLYFPLGNIDSKETVRQHFEKVHIKTAQKKDSLGICFISHKQHTRFLRELNSSAMMRGCFVDKSGNFLGYHQGIASYTLGQKRKLADELSGKFVVIDILPESNAVVLGEENDLLKYKLTAKSFNLVNSYHTFPLKVQVIVSQWSAVYEGILTPYSDGSAEITFESPVRAPSCGQAMVCYQYSLLIGGGIITQVE